MYRVTPKRGKYKVERISDRKQIGKLFQKISDAKAEVIKLLGEAPGVISGWTVHKAYEDFVNWQFANTGPGKRLNKKSVDPYDYDFKLRIS